MELRKTHIAALALAGVVAASAATPSFADSRWGYAAGGFAAGAIVGSAAARSWAYDPYPYGYAYAPAPRYYAPAPGYMAYGYAPEVSTTYTVRPRVYSYSYRPNRAPVFDPENGDDPDPRIGGSFKMNTSGKD